MEIEAVYNVCASEPVHKVRNLCNDSDIAWIERSSENAVSTTRRPGFKVISVKHLLCQLGVAAKYGSLDSILGGNVVVLD